MQSMGFASKQSADALANRCGYKFADDDDTEYGDENDGDLLPQKLVDRGIKEDADAPGPDKSENGGLTDIDVPAVNGGTVNDR